MVEKYNLKYKDCHWFFPTFFRFDEIAEVSDVTVHYKNSFLGKKPHRYFIACTKCGITGIEVPISNDVKQLKKGDRIRIFGEVVGCITSGYDRFSAYLEIVPNSTGFEIL